MTSMRNGECGMGAKIYVTPGGRTKRESRDFRAESGTARMILPDVPRGHRSGAELASLETGDGRSKGHDNWGLERTQPSNHMVEKEIFLISPPSPSLKSQDRLR